MFRGDDKLVRVVDVKTENGLLRRAITQVAPLPCFPEDELNVQKSNESQHLMLDTDDGSSNDKVVANCTNANISSNKSRSVFSRIMPNLFQIIFYIFLMLPIILAKQQLNVTQFNHHPGLFFDGIGKTNIVSEKWHIVTFYNMTDHWEQFNVLKQSFETVMNLCKSRSCMASITEVNQHFLDIK